MIRGMTSTTLSELFDRAMEALEDKMDLAEARSVDLDDLVSHEDLMEELGFNSNA